MDIEKQPMLSPHKVKDTHKKCKRIGCYTGIVIMVIIVFGIAIHILLKRRHKNECASEKLDVRELINDWPSPECWNVVRYGHGEGLISIFDDSLKVEYPKGSWAPSAIPQGGMNFYCSPEPVFPTDQVEFYFQVAFDSTFEWVKGGKLLGLWIGEIGASGGNHIEDGASIRIAWRSGGRAAVYLYIPTDQHGSFDEELGYSTNGPYGISLWRDDFQLISNMQWNNVTMIVKLNKEKYDGMLTVNINNVSKTYTKMNWRGNQGHKINGIMMNTFFGGNDSSWATPATTWSYFRNITIH